MGNADIRVGAMSTSGRIARPVRFLRFQLTSAPEHGKIAVKTAKVILSNYKQCLAMVPAFAVESIHVVIVSLTQFLKYLQTVERLELADHLKSTAR
jgi:hypothetical protein